MSKPVALVTGAGGEMGQALIPVLDERGCDVVALDLNALPPALEAHCVAGFRRDILDGEAMRELFERFAPTRVYHLAALLSSHAERDPDRAHRVNVDGTLGLLHLCRRSPRGPVRFLFPSSIAVYGLPDRRTKEAEGALREGQWLHPSSIYGCNKLYCELVGAYLSRRAPGAAEQVLDFRAIRFPGVVSAETLPSGGTTDFAPEMVHAAAQGRPYACFVEESTRLPFTTMPDAVGALLRLAEADPGKLSARVYNIRGFSCSAGEIRQEVLRAFPAARVTFAPLPERQAIVDSWPADVDDTRAREDWGHAPRHGLAEAFRDYLAPALRQRYAAAPLGSGPWVDPTRSQDE
jgi:nucleoside-diphosphate-sugar epimerase